MSNTEIKLDRSSFRIAEDKLRTAIDDMTDQLKAFKKTKKKLLGGWQGEAKKVGEKKIKGIQTDYEEMIKELKTLKNELDQLKKTFEDADESVAQQIRVYI